MARNLRLVGHTNTVTAAAAASAICATVDAHATTANAYFHPRLHHLDRHRSDRHRFQQHHCHRFHHCHHRLTATTATTVAAGGINSRRTLGARARTTKSRAGARALA